MKHTARAILLLVIVLLAASLSAQGPAQNTPRPSPAIKTPLPQEILTLLSNEVSGQFAFNNLVRLAGAPWIRDPKEFSGPMEETQRMFDLVKGYGIDTVRIERYPVTGTTDYPLEGEFWTLEPGATATWSTTVVAVTTSPSRRRSPRGTRCRGPRRARAPRRATTS